MTQKIITNKFRSVFKVVEKESLRWFPGHMEKGLKQMQHKLRQVDCIFEVHDARIPISGKNADFKHTISGIKPHILVLNKVDLIDTKMIPRIKQTLKKEYANVVFTNCKDQKCKGVENLFPLAQKLINNSDRFNRVDAEDYNVMIIGIPNVGKSSLINTLRNRFLGKANASPVGAVPGITRSVLMKIRMCDDPLFFMLDTPGILTPKIENTEVGLKLALCNTLQDHLVGEPIIADYLLFWLNKHERFDYVDYFKLKGASDDILEVLTQIAVDKKKMLKLRDSSNQYVFRPDITSASKEMIKAFRNGDLGKIMLDEEFV